MSFDMDLFHYHQYNRIGDGSRTIIGVFTGPVKHDYTVRLWYSLEQRLWLAEFGPAFEEAVLEHRVLPFFEKLYDSWFSSWPEDEFAIKVDLIIVIIIARLVYLWTPFLSDSVELKAFSSKLTTKMGQTVSHFDVAMRRPTPALISPCLTLPKRFLRGK
ncbi:uncharacterized protein ARMOST_09058 [Armillaria ostoyae]|uniref:Uncharacterized protein n=1 Tax=Armillaria ostoyae TaxID=47428 RepID=A0A284RAG3_ARMOS|nr:uncharacterized protein ARMOST_09058 [Armillaria ostoyae]